MACMVHTYTPNREKESKTVSEQNAIASTHAKNSAKVCHTRI